jgi:hypothetical protein
MAASTFTGYLKALYSETVKYTASVDLTATIKLTVIVCGGESLSLDPAHAPDLFLMVNDFNTATQKFSFAYKTWFSITSSAHAECKIEKYWVASCTDP